MKYEVKEKKFFENIGIKQIIDYSYFFKHLETTFDLEKYLLELKVSIENMNNEIMDKEFNLPIEFNTSMTEQLTAKLIKVEANLLENKGINFEIFLEVNIDEITNSEEEIIQEKQEIKEIYQKELEEKLDSREQIISEEVAQVIYDTDEDVRGDNFLNLNTDFVRYKVINLDDNSLDKISVKYGLSINYLYELKNTKSKLIVHDNE